MVIRLLQVVHIVADRGGVEIAQAEIDNGVNTGAVAMARNIVTTQQAQIDQMTKMLEGR